MHRWFGMIGGLLGFVAVAAGGVAAHGLGEALGPRRMEIFQTGARYQMYHALALLAIAWLAHRRPGPLIAAAGWAMIGGMVVFSGSLYVLALTDIGWLGAITPLGGVAQLLGWLLLAAAAFRAR